MWVCAWMQILETKAVEHTAKWREDDTSLILCTALSSHESLEGKKNRAEEVTYMVCVRERELSAASGVYFWSICAPLNGFLPRVEDWQ